MQKPEAGKRLVLSRKDKYNWTDGEQREERPEMKAMCRRDLQAAA